MNATQDIFRSIMFTTLPQAREDLFEEAGTTHRSEGPSDIMLSACSSFQLSEFSSSDEDDSERGQIQASLGVSGLQLKELLGRGSCGSVYKAVWKGLPVAVKVGTSLSWRAQHLRW